MPPINLLAAAVLALLLVLVIAQIWGGGDLGRRLDAAGWTLYLKPGCPACTLQQRHLRLLDAAQLPRREVCGADGGAQCAAFTAFPAWHNARTGETRYGVQTACQLRGMAAAK